METHYETLIWLGVLLRVGCWTGFHGAILKPLYTMETWKIVELWYLTVRCLADGLDGGRDLKGGQHISTVQLVLQGFFERISHDSTNLWAKAPHDLPSWPLCWFVRCKPRPTRSPCCNDEALRGDSQIWKHTWTPVRVSSKAWHAAKVRNITTAVAE